MAGPNVNRNGPDSGLFGSWKPQKPCHSGAMRSIELWGAIAPLRISRFRVRFAPRNDGIGESPAKQILREFDHGLARRDLLAMLVLDHHIDQHPARFFAGLLGLDYP